MSATGGLGLTYAAVCVCVCVCVCTGDMNKECNSITVQCYITPQRVVGKLQDSIKCT